MFAHRLFAVYAAYIRDEFPEVVFVEDVGTGMSVTNNAEAVVERVAAAHPGRRIIYRDSEGDWDELLHRSGVFVDFAALGDGDAARFAPVTGGRHGLRS